MIWAGISYGGKTKLVIINGTRDRYLKEIVLLVVYPLVMTASNCRQSVIAFQDDNARPHRSSNVISSSNDLRVQTLSWPARSPDVSPIEHVWDELGRRTRERY